MPSTTMLFPLKDARLTCSPLEEVSVKSGYPESFGSVMHPDIMIPAIHSRRTIIETLRSIFHVPFCWILHDEHCGHNGLAASFYASRLSLYFRSRRHELCSPIIMKMHPAGSAVILTAYGCENNADKMSALPVRAPGKAFSKQI